MLQYKSLAGQSLWDICLMTYGSFDLMTKMLQDNGINNVNDVPYSGQSIGWDETLTADQRVNQTLTASKKIFATATMINGNVLSLAKVENSQGGITYPQTQPYQPSNPVVIQQYEKTISTEYVAQGGETEFTLSELIGATIIQIEAEIKPFLKSEFSLNKNTGKVTLQYPLDAGVILFIIYTQIINA